MCISDMKSNKDSLRPIGQRSITSTFLFRASNRSIDSKRDVEIKSPTRKSSHISLSDFLNRKLHRSSVLPTSVQGKEVSFSTPSRNDHLGAQVERGEKKQREEEAKCLNDDAFYMFKNVDMGNEAGSTNLANEVEIIDVDDLQQTRKRKNQFEGHDDKPTTRKRLVVLGEDSKPLQSSRRKNFVIKEPKPLYNHYENGGGWWNENMEGVDNEEVGCNDVWEGVGCTTLGGIEWH